MGGEPPKATLPWVHVLHYNITSTMLRVHTDVFMKVYWYSINSVTTMVVTGFSEDLQIAVILQGP